MKRRGWVLTGLAIPVAAVAVMTGVGALLPEAHTASSARVVEGTPGEVWAVVTDVTAFPSWRPEVEEVEMRAGGAVSSLAWVESGGGGTLPMRVTRAQPPSLLVTEIGAGLPFGGSWTYRLEPTEGGTRVGLTEDGEVYNPFFRFVSRFVMGHEATMERYLDALEERMAAGSGGAT